MHLAAEKWIKSAYTIKNAGSKFAFVRRSFVDIAVAIEP